MRYPDATTDLHDICLFEAKRRVHKDRTVSLHGRLYEVDPILVGENVILRYDPDAPPNRPLDVVHDAKPAGLATRAAAASGRTGSVQRFSIAPTGDGNHPRGPRRTAVCGALGRSPYSGRKRVSSHRLAGYNRTVRQNRNNVRNPRIDPSK